MNMKFYLILLQITVDSFEKSRKNVEVDQRVSDYEMKF